MKELTMKEQHDLNILQKHTTTIRKDGSRRVQLDLSEPQITDQSSKNAVDINNILKQYSSQGVTPQIVTDPAFYRDNTNIPSIETAFNIAQTASEAFSQLPATIRKDMDNDPSKLESYLRDPNNTDILIKHGLLAAKPAPVEPIKELKPDASSKIPKDPTT